MGQEEPLPVAQRLGGRVVHWLVQSTAGKGPDAEARHPLTAVPDWQWKKAVEAAGQGVVMGQRAMVVTAVVHWLEQSAAGKVPKAAGRQPLTAEPAWQ